MNDAMRLVVFKKEEIKVPDQQEPEPAVDGLLEEESVSKIDEIMSDGSLDSQKKCDPVILLFRIIFDHSNNRLTRVAMFKNLLVQKLWRTFAESRVFNLYLHTIRDKYGE